MIFKNSKNTPGTLEALGNTHLDLWKNTGPSQAKLHMTRRAVVSGVIRVQMGTNRLKLTYGIHGLGSLKQIVELCVKLRTICTHLSCMTRSAVVARVMHSLAGSKRLPPALVLL